jgi:hypothetical protein
MQIEKDDNVLMEEPRLEWWKFERMNVAPDRPLFLLPHPFVDC